MPVVFRNDHWELERDPARPLLIVRRTGTSYATLTDMARSFAELEAAIDACGRPLFSLIVDLRESPFRNDPEFERASAGHPKGMARGFVRTAVLVRTALGVLQITRHSRQSGIVAPAFTSEAEALAYLGLEGP